jgi:hypothetical protein
MNKSRIIKILIIVFISIIILVYFINLIYRISKKRDIIDATGQKIEELSSSIKKEIVNQNLLEKTNKNFLETAYFEKGEDYFENYIRTLFKKYNIKIIIYRSKMNEKNYSELDVNFNTDALTFFKLIKDAEEGEKIIVIRRLTISKLKVPNFQVEMKLGGYYKE